MTEVLLAVGYLAAVMVVSVVIGKCIANQDRDE